MAVVFEYPDNGYVPSALASQLHDAGVAVLGVTVNEAEQSVQVVCDDGQAKGPVTKAVNAYAAPDPAAEVRASKQAEIMAALTASDWWAARAIEDGVAMPDDRKAYRQQLRALHAQTVSLTDPAAIQSLELPALPPAA